MAFFLALKNTRLYFLKRLPLALFLAATMGLLFLGNTIFSGTDEGLSRAFQNSLTADLSVSAASEDPFTLFGSELPLLGEFFKMPLILDYNNVLDTVRKTLPSAQLQPLVVGGAKLSRESFSSATPWFAVDMRSYFAFFPSLKIVMGTPPEPGSPGLFLNQRLYEKASTRIGHPLALGDKFLLTAAQDGSFALREVPLSGVFDYPVYDSALERVALVDVGTGRALAGYFVTQAAAGHSSDSSAGSSVDDLFAGAADTRAPTTGGITFEKVTRDLAQNTQAPVADPRTWNFLLVRTPHPARDGAVLAQALQTAAAPLQIRDWRETAGGNAKIVWFIQLLFNLGLIFVSIVAGLIVMNSMSLAVAERSHEFGTMRSLGAPRTLVAQLVSWETVILVAGASIVGIGAGSLAIGILRVAGGVAIQNPFLATLLGTSQYVPRFSWALTMGHVVLSFVLGAFATILPIVRALRVTPLQAMVRE